MSRIIRNMVLMVSMLGILCQLGGCALLQDSAACSRANPYAAEMIARQQYFMIEHQFRHR